ncbi:uncharacterized protein RJT21DRAFT_120972, partial [Scheffersomyces amazonensis]|uniref:uncharacterized protein n=1 Tax=Scheffersomyces amazonensis TaxID=1078765 RepID=UPI00315E029E
MAHAPSLSIAAIATMGSVGVIYLLIKSPLKYQYLSENRVSPKADLAWRNAAQKWLDS